MYSCSSLSMSKVLLFTAVFAVPIQESSSCPSWMFRCSYWYNRCIYRYQVCDGVYNCYYGEDERSCSSALPSVVPSVELSSIVPSQTTAPRLLTTATSNCSYWQFSCEDGSCIRYSWKCDGYRDCWDGSDEWRCFSSQGPASIMPSPTTTAQVQNTSSSLCPYWMFSCRRYGQCIYRYQVCNGYRDCYDGSDEWSCPIGSSSIIPSATLGIITAVTTAPSSSATPTVTTASQFQVICGNDGITVLAHRSSLPKSTNVNGLHLLDRRCRANYNQTHIFIKTSLTGCGTRYKETDQKVFFSNALSEEPSSFASKDVITRSHLLNVNFTCSYGRKRTVGSFSFQPARQRLSVSLSGVGNFTVTIDFFKSNAFREAYTTNDYPVFKRLSQNIYIQYSINTSNPDLVVRAETCRATPSNKPYDTPQYVFIADGCDKDDTIRHYTLGMGQIQRFSIKAFRFLTEHRLVYIHCDLVVCNRNLQNSTCARDHSCGTRVRRDVDEMSSLDDSSQMYPLSFGPMAYSKQSSVDDKQSGGSDVNGNSALIGSLIGLGCLAVILGSALVYVKRRSRISRKNERKPTPEVLSMENVAAAAD